MTAPQSQANVTGEVWRHFISEFVDMLGQKRNDLVVIHTLEICHNGFLSLYWWHRAYHFDAVKLDPGFKRLMFYIVLRRAASNTAVLNIATKNSASPLTACRLPCLQNHFLHDVALFLCQSRQAVRAASSAGTPLAIAMAR